MHKAYCSHMQPLRTSVRWNAASATRQRLSTQWPAHSVHKHSSSRVVPTAALGRRALLGTLAPCCCGCCSCRHRNSWYDRYFAFNMAHGMEEYEAAVAPLKQALFKQLLTPLADSSSRADAASILEVGVGTGPNLPYYTRTLQEQTPAAVTAASRESAQQQLRANSWVVTGVEPNPAMWEYAQASAQQAGLSKQQLQLVAADAQQMPFEHESFDAAVVTLVLCSLPNPKAALSEVFRVLKPGGQLLLIEHVIAPQLSWIQVQQRLLNPLQRLLADNCHLTRNTAATVQSSGFVPQPLHLPEGLADLQTLQLQEGAIGGVDGPGRGTTQSRSNGGGLLHFEVEGMGLIAPHVAGILQKPLGV